MNRVSEWISLGVRDVMMQDHLVRVFGKGAKERCATDCTDIVVNAPATAPMETQPTILNLVFIKTYPSYGDNIHLGVCSAPLGSPDKPTSCCLLSLTLVGHCGCGQGGCLGITQIIMTNGF